MIDLASILARAIVDDIADEIRSDSQLRRRMTDRLRDELHAIEQRLVHEIRRKDE
jgi:hypothetical protein